MADQRRVQTWVIVGVVLGATLFGCFVFGVIMAAIMLPVFTQAREKAKTVSCMSNQSQIARALQMYAADNDVLPAASQWTDKVKPYLATITFSSALRQSNSDAATLSIAR